MIPKKLSKGIWKLVLGESNCLVLFWQSKIASRARNCDLNASNLAAIGILLNDKR